MVGQMDSNPYGSKTCMAAMGLLSDPCFRSVISWPTWAPQSNSKKNTVELGSEISYFILDSSPISGGFEWKRLLNDLIDSDT